MRVAVTLFIATVLVLPAGCSGSTGQPSTVPGPFSSASSTSSSVSGSTTTVAAVSTTEAQERALSPDDPDLVFNPALEFEDVMDYLSSRIDEVAVSRDAYWSRDFSSVEGYLASITRYRSDFRALIGVPTACPGTSPPLLTDDRLVGFVSGIELRAWVVSVCDGRLTSYLLAAIPDPEPQAAVVAVAGTCGSPERVMGLQGDDYHNQFGLRLAQAGYLVVAPLITTLPTKSGEECASPTNELRNQLDHRAMPLGDRLIGIEVGKLMDVSAFLEARGFDQIGVYGISLGGLLSFAAGAVESRYDATVVSQWLEDRTQKLVGEDYPTAYWLYEDADYVFFPEQLEVFTDVDVASLVVPRAFFVEVGAEDPRAETVETVMRRAEEFWLRLGFDDGRVAFSVEPAGHEVVLDSSLAFLLRWLEP